MKKSSMDLMVGGSILIALLILVSGVLWLKEVSLNSSMVQYSILFPEIGVLQPGDPVMVNGVKMGTVASEALEGIRVKVVINLDRSVILTDSTEVTVQNIGLMGERTVGIRLSDKGNLIQPNDKKGVASQYIHGKFDTGIAEAVGMVGTVLGDIRVVVKNVDGIVNNTIGDTSFNTFFHRIITRLDTVTLLVDQLIKQNDDKISKSVNQIQEITTEINRLIKDNQSNINTILDNGAELSEKALQIAAEVDSISTSVHAMTSAIEQGEGSVGKLLKDEQFYADLKRTVSKLDTLVTDVNVRGLKLRIVGLGYTKKEKSKLKQIKHD